jgi:protein SMG6
MHGMLFTRIQMDDFPTMFERFMERLEEDAHLDEDNTSTRKHIKETDWILMANINIAALMQYGSDESLLKKALAEESASRKIQKLPSVILSTENSAYSQNKAEDNPSASDPVSAPDGQGLCGDLGEARQDRRGSLPPRKAEPSLLDRPANFQYTCELSFRMLEFCFKYPLRHWSFFDKLNPYITSILTFLCTIVRQSTGLATLERSVPWTSLVSFLNSIPEPIDIQAESSQKLTGGIPLPEDWCMRGMEWVGRRVFERGFWKARAISAAGEVTGGPSLQYTPVEMSNEMDVLLSEHDPLGTDEMEHALDEVGESTGHDYPGSITHRRWKRVAWTANSLVRHVSGLDLNQQVGHGYVLEGSLAQKLSGWKQEELEHEQAESRRRRRDEEARGEWPDDVAMGPDLGEDEDDTTTDDPLLLELRERRRKLQALVQGHQRSPSRPDRAVSKQPISLPTSASAVSGYTVLVLDTNVLLSSLELVAALIESARWTVVVPLPGMCSELNVEYSGRLMFRVLPVLLVVITELDGLTRQTTALGPAAAAAVRYLEQSVKSHSISLKIQTSKGNYLSNLLIRSEMIDGGTTHSQDGQATRLPTMDDHILKVAGLQLANFVDRSRLLHGNIPAPSEEAKKKALKVMFLTLDRNLRLRARARGIEAANEKDMAEVFAGARP